MTQFSTDADVYFSYDKEKVDSPPVLLLSNFIDTPKGANQPKPLGFKAAKNALRTKAKGQTPVSRQ
jgi:hypothetical protein